MKDVPPPQMQCFQTSLIWTKFNHTSMEFYYAPPLDPNSEIGSLAEVPEMHLNPNLCQFKFDTFYMLTEGGMDLGLFMDFNYAEVVKHAAIKQVSRPSSAKLLS